MHEIVEQVTIAFNRLAYEAHDYPERDADVAVVEDYLAMIDVHCTGLQSAHAYQLREAQRWFRRASELDDQVRALRAEVNQSRAQLAAMSTAAQAICDQMTAGADIAGNARFPRSG